jgi:hypothetical protein
MKNQITTQICRTLAPLGCDHLLNTNTHFYKLLHGEPIRKKPAKPITDKQLSNRTKWKLATQFAAKFSPAFTIARKYDKRKQKWCQSDLVKHLMDVAIVGSYPAFRIDYPKVRISKGYSRHFVDFATSIAATGQLSITFEVSDVVISPKGDEKMILCLYNANTDTGYCWEENINLSQLEITYQIPSYDRRGEYHLWLFEASPRNKEVGNTYYFKL